MNFAKASLILFRSVAIDTCCSKKQLLTFHKYCFPNISHLCTLVHASYFQDPVSEIRKLADFLNVQYTNQFLQEIADKCSFSKLKASQKEIKETAENTEGEKPESTRKGMKLDVYRKGMI